MSERQGRSQFDRYEQKEVDALSGKSLAERITGLNKLIRKKGDAIGANVIGAVFSGEISGGLIVAQQLDLISDNRWYLIPEILFGMAVVGGVTEIQEQRRKRKALKEMLSTQNQIALHPEAKGDETLARSVFELDVCPSDTQLSNLKKVLDTLRQQNLLKDEPPEF